MQKTAQKKKSSKNETISNIGKNGLYARTTASPKTLNLGQKLKFPKIPIKSSSTQKTPKKKH